MEATAAGPDLSRQAVCRLPSDYEFFDVTRPLLGLRAHTKMSACVKESAYHEQRRSIWPEPPWSLLGGLLQTGLEE